MGRPEKPLDRDGSAVREFAFWLRDLRKRSGLTYDQLGKNAHYATSTVQAATAGNRFPTLRVTMAIVKACGGDTREWRDYWTQIQRALDRGAPDGLERPITPPWASPATTAIPVPVSTPEGSAATSEVKPQRREAGDGWFTESFTALLRLDIEPIEAMERRLIVATTDDLTELATSVSVPRHPDDVSGGHGLDSELLYGGSLELREQPYESYFRNVIVLPRPLRQGERHEYALRLRIPPGQPMAPHYVYVPFHPSDHFDLRIRFPLRDPPRAVWVLRAVPTAVIYEGKPTAETLVPDRFGEVHVSFHDLQLGFGYGLCWTELSD
ncbi:MAG: helix-turn-helix transcriptional regulator [Streptosporangiaceae bacterium]|nr:helix-turn-helix transcriptional regulator [Streptosporangiaceae bacterium]